MKTQVREPLVTSNLTLGDRSHIDLLSHKTYLNYASISPASILTKATLDEWYYTYSTMGSTAYPL